MNSSSLRTLPKNYTRHKEVFDIRPGESRPRTGISIDKFHSAVERVRQGGGDHPFPGADRLDILENSTSLNELINANEREGDSFRIKTSGDLVQAAGKLKAVEDSELSSVEAKLSRNSLATILGTTAAVAGAAVMGVAALPVLAPLINFIMPIGLASSVLGFSFCIFC